MLNEWSTAISSNRFPAAIAARIRQAMLTHPSRALVENGRLIKRRSVSGEWVRTLHVPAAAADVPMATAAAGLSARIRRTMSKMSHGMNSLSSTGSFIGGSEQGVVGLRMVGAEFSLAGGVQFFAEPRRVGGEIFLFHPAQERLPRHFVGVGVTLGQLLLDEFLNRLCHGDFHALKLAQVDKTDNAQIRRRRCRR